MNHRHRPLLAAALLALARLAFAQDVAQPLAENPDGGEAIPPSGLHATTTGDHVLIFQDGSWKKRPPLPGVATIAITDQGRTVALSERSDPKSGKIVREWNYTSPSNGMIQVVVSRAITTDRSAHSNRDNCIPVITARNLTDTTMFRLIAELEFETKGSHRSAVSVMLGPLDGGEEEEKVASPLFVPECEYLSAKLHIPYCTFTNGLDCGALVTASRYGTISLEMAEKTSAP